MLGIYCRTSKARKEKYTIENQKDSGIICAQKLGVPYRIYIDDGVSGTTDESIRGGLSDLFRDMKSKEISAVYVIDQSRVERDTTTWQIFVSLCLNNKILYYPGGSILDLDNPTNKMYANLMSVVNSYYSEITSRKVKDANAKKVKVGKTHGLKPYGYIRDISNNYVICEEEAKIVKRMFELSLSGIGAYYIAKILNGEGVPTKFSKNFKGTITRKDPYTKKIKLFEKSKIIWRGNVISDILKNPIYKGTRIWQKHEDNIEFKDGKKIKTKKVVEVITTENHVPPIVDKELWEKVQSNFQKNKKNVGPKEKYNYLLNGIINCSICGGEYRGKKRPKGNDDSYKCSKNGGDKSVKCSNRGISIPRLETFIIRLLILDNDSYKLFENIPNKESNIQTYSNQLHNKQKELDKISKQIKNLISLASSLGENKSMSEISDELANFSKKKDRITEDIQELEKKIRHESSGSFDELLKKNSEVLNSISEKFDNISNFDAIKKITHELIEAISVLFVSEDNYYYIEIMLKGKENPIKAHTDKNSDWWVISGSKSNTDINDFDLPDSLKGNGIGIEMIEGLIYRYDKHIPKEKYFNFN
jgi:site-specific DNA recombinase